MADISPEGINKSYQLACGLFEKKKYEESRKLFKICIQVSNDSM